MSTLLGSSGRPESSAELRRELQRADDGKVPVVIDGRTYRVHPATARALGNCEDCGGEFIVGSHFCFGGER